METFTFRILPVLMIVAAIGFGVRFSEFVSGAKVAATDLAQIEPAADESMADAATGSASESKTGVAAPPSAEALSGSGTQGKPEIEAPSLGKAPAVPDTSDAEWRGADDLDDEYSDVKMELFSDLSKRRRDLETREKELSMREALLKAGQAELEQKYQELTIIKADIEELLKKQTEEEDERIASLVKIYEGMKAKDAARIFNSLDMDVLMQVVTKMSERKSAPIIAAMDPEKARNVTIMLAEQNKLPNLPALTATP